MKNKIFSHLLEKFAAINQHMLPGGKRNPENTWAFRMIETLSEVAAAIENGDTDLKKVTAAFQNLKAASEVMLGRGRGGVPGEMQPLFTALLAAQKPIDCCLKNLKNGKTLDEALADPSWLEGLFTDTPKVEEREGYVPGKFNLEGMNQKDIFDAYKKDAAQAQRIMEQHMKDLTGDEYDPHGMLEAKLALMQDFINASIKEPLEGDRKDFFRSKFNELYKRFDQKQDADLSSNRYVMSNAFFSTEMDSIFSSGILSGNIMDINDLNERTSSLLQKEMQKFRLSPAKMGFSDEMIERFETYAYTVQSLKKHLGSLQFEIDNSDLGEDPDLTSLVEDLRSITDKQTGYIRGDDGAQMPTNKQYIDATEKLEALMAKYTLFNGENNRSKDFQYNGITTILFEMLQGIARSVPELSHTIQPKIQQQEKKYKMEFLKKQEQLKSLAKDNAEQTKAANYLAGARKNTFDEDFKIKATCIRMARDPIYNRKLVEELPGVFEKFLQNMEKMPGHGGHDLFKDTTYSNEPIAPEQNYRNAYTLYLLGKHFLKEREKITAAENPRLSAGERVRNLVNPEIRRLMTGETIDKTFLSSIDNMVDHVRDTEVFRNLEARGPRVMNQILQSPDKEKGLMDALNEPELNFLKGVSDNIHEAMMQISGSNSPSYQKMSEAYKNIFEKNDFPGSAERSDYMKLYDACKEYANAHDSKPFKDNGKLREINAMGLMFRVGRELAKNDPEFAGKYQNDHAMNMARSKQYRDAAARYEKDQIRGILSRNSNAYKNGFKALPPDAQKKLAEHYDMLAIAQGFDKALENVSGHEITGKITDPKVKEKLRVCFADMKENRDIYAGSFNADPDNKLNQIVPREAAAQKGNVL